MNKLSEIEIPLPKLSEGARLTLIGITVVPICLFVDINVVQRLPQGSGGPAPGVDLSIYADLILMSVGLTASYPVIRWLLAVLKVVNRLMSSRPRRGVDPPRTPDG
jgi:hypothetical protein